MATVPNTIRDQLGGRALYMLGAKNIWGEGHTLGFKIGRNAKRINAITITLDPDDTYTVKFLRQKGAPTFEVTTVAEENGIYVDMLHDTITRNTGLHTSL